PGAYAKIAGADDPAAALLEVAPAGHPGLLLATEARMARLRELLAVGPHRAGELADLLFDRVDEPSERRRYLDALVTAGGRLTGPDGLAVLSARYHLFVRATEGAYTCLSPTGPHVTLARHERCQQCSAVVFEFGACKRCGSLHLSGSVRPGQEGLTFGPQRPGERRTWLLLEQGADITDEDDETLDEEATSTLDSKDAALCPACGGLYEHTHATCTRNGCAGTKLLPVRRLNTPK